MIFLNFLHLVDQVVHIGTTLLIAMTTTQDNKNIFEQLIKNSRKVRKSNFIISVDTMPPWMSYCINCTVSLISTFAWNYLNVLIIVISVGLSTHLKLINDELEQAVLQSESIDHSHLIGLNLILEVNFRLTWNWAMLSIFYWLNKNSTNRNIITNSGCVCVKTISKCLVISNWWMTSSAP